MESVILNISMKSAERVVFHLVSGMYSLCLAYVYTFLARPEMYNYVKLLQLMPQDNYSWIIALYACISTSNLYSWR